VFAAAALLPTDFEEAGRAGRKGEAATVARRLLGQFIYADLKALKRLSCAASLLNYEWAAHFYNRDIASLHVQFGAACGVVALRAACLCLANVGPALSCLLHSRHVVNRKGVDVHLFFYLRPFLRRFRRQVKFLRVVCF
jgi:hypothetical protein